MRIGRAPRLPQHAPDDPGRLDRPDDRDEGGRGRERGRGDIRGSDRQAAAAKIGPHARPGWQVVEGRSPACGGGGASHCPSPASARNGPHRSARSLADEGQDREPRQAPAGGGDLVRRSPRRRVRAGRRFRRVGAPGQRSVAAVGLAAGEDRAGRGGHRRLVHTVERVPQCGGPSGASRTPRADAHVRDPVPSVPPGRGLGSPGEVWVRLFGSGRISPAAATG